MKKTLDWDLVALIAMSLGVKPKTFDKWREPGRGVPHKWRRSLIRASKGKLPSDAFDVFDDEGARA